MLNSHLIQVFNTPHGQCRLFTLNEPTITLPLIVKKLVQCLILLHSRNNNVTVLLFESP
jgi:ABC-type branched-subunit amino acid transport system ATPase component